MSTFGTHFRVTTYGESHCRSVGCIVDGVPPGMPLTEGDIQPQMTRRVGLSVTHPLGAP
jgi:chorismate synthase